MITAHECPAAHANATHKEREREGPGTEPRTVAVLTKGHHDLVSINHTQSEKNELRTSSLDHQTTKSFFSHQWYAVQPQADNCIQKKTAADSLFLFSLQGTVYS